MLLSVVNRWSSRPATGDVDAVVSLTTYGPRFRKVHLAIESIARGSVRPRKLVLWIDDPELYAHPTPSLSRLMARGLEIRTCDDFGPHKKYFPALELVTSGEVSRLVTADDDTLYPRDWLRELDELARRHPSDVICHRARIAQVHESGFEPWDTWPHCDSAEPSVRHFAIGDAGVSYPTPVAEELASRGLAFAERAPRADDVWLHAASISAGAQVRQVRDSPAVPVGVPGTQVVALRDQNVTERLNDRQIQATYSPANHRLLLQAQSGN